MNDFETTKQVSPLTNSELEREAFAAGMMKAAEICLGEQVDYEATHDTLDAAYNVALDHAATAIREAIPADSKAALRDTEIVDYLESLGQGFRVSVDLDAAYDGERKIRLSVNRGGVNDPELEPVAEGSSLRAIVNSVLEGKS